MYALYFDSRGGKYPFPRFVRIVEIQRMVAFLKIYTLKIIGFFLSCYQVYLRVCVCY